MWSFIETLAMCCRDIAMALRDGRRSSVDFGISGQDRMYPYLRISRASSFSRMPELWNDGIVDPGVEGKVDSGSLSLMTICTIDACPTHRTASTRLKRSNGHLMRIVLFDEMVELQDRR